MRPRPPVFLLALAIGVASPAAAQPPANPDPAALLDRAKQVLAPLDGEIRLPGLKEPVEVLRDRWGVAHIYAKNAHDLFFAQGFVVAQDRLFQIDLWRRQAAGEMAEVFGPGHVEADRFARLMKYRGDMDAEWASYAPDARAIATAFTAGINAGIDQFGDRLAGRVPAPRPPAEEVAAGGRPRPDVGHLHVAELPQRGPAGAARRGGRRREGPVARPGRPAAGVRLRARAATTCGRSTTASWPGTTAATKPLSFTPGEDGEQQLGRRRRPVGVRQAAAGQRPAPGHRPAVAALPRPPERARAGT